MLKYLSLIVLLLFSCKKEPKIKFDTNKLKTEEESITISKDRVKKDDIITIKAKIFAPDTKIYLNLIENEHLSLTSKILQFKLTGSYPKDSLISLILKSESTDFIFKANLLFESDESQDALSELVCNQYHFKIDNSWQKGTKNCSTNAGLVYCSSSLEENCITSSSVKAISSEELSVVLSKLSETQSLLGETGKLKSCTEDNQTGCVLNNENLFSVNKSAINTDSILLGENILGREGNLTLPLESEVKSGVSFGASKTGSLKLNCQNLIDHSTYDIGVAILSDSLDATDTITTRSPHSFTVGSKVKFSWPTSGSLGVSDFDIYYVKTVSGNSIQISSTLGGAVKNLGTSSNFAIYSDSDGALDYVDSVDDYNNAKGILSLNMPSITDGEMCQGSGEESDKIWVDITEDGCSPSKECIMKDKNSGLSWSKKITSSGVQWATAVAMCSALDYGGHQDWRLPTQKEMMAAYVSSISAAASPDWITQASFFTSSFWTGTRYSGSIYESFSAQLSKGNVTNSPYSSTLQAVCVR